MTRAVVFDLWETLVEFDPASSRTTIESIADRLGRDREQFAADWARERELREVGPLAGFLEAIGVDAAARGDVSARHRDWARRSLVPRDGAIATLAELQRRGLRLGLLSVCSDAVPAVWSETPFAGRFDAEVFSCDVGMKKPDPRIYRLACDSLGVEPGDAVFVGDGANDELAGAERAGLRAILIHRPGEEPPWPEARVWTGARITALPEVLDLV